MTRSRIVIAVLVVLVVFAGVILWSLRAPSAAPVAQSGEPPTEVTSRDGFFRVSYTVDAGKIPLNSLHTWTVHVTDSDGQPVTGAKISVDGGMPAHGHGLPTQPQVSAELGDGDYRVEGLRFQMVGEWVVSFTIQAAGFTDTATVAFTLR